MSAEKMKDLTIKKLQDERSDKEKLRYTKWINSFLAPLSMDVNDLYVDLADGKKLAKFLEILSGQELPKLNNKCTRRIQQIENLNICLSFLKSKVKLDNISAENILDGDRNYILCLLWTIQLKFIGKNEMFETVIEKNSDNNAEVKCDNFNVTMNKKDEDESTSSSQISENLEDNDVQTLGDFKKEKLDSTSTISDNLEDNDPQTFEDLKKEEIYSTSSQIFENLEHNDPQTLGDYKKEKVASTSQIYNNLEDNDPQTFIDLSKEKVDYTSQIFNNLEDNDFQTLGDLNKEKVTNTSSSQFANNVEPQTLEDLKTKKVDIVSSQIPEILEDLENNGLQPVELDKGKPDSASSSQVLNNLDDEDLQDLDIRDDHQNLDLEEEDFKKLDYLQKEENHEKITQKTSNYDNSEFSWYTVISSLLVLGILILSLPNIEQIFM